MTITALPSTTWAVRDWLRTVPEVLEALPAAGGKTARIGTSYFGDTPTTPNAVKETCIEIHRAGGSMDASGHLDYATLQLECWGATEAAAVRLQLRVVGALLALGDAERTPLNDDVLSLGVFDVNSVEVPDPTTGQDRYVVTARLITQPAA